MIEICSISYYSSVKVYKVLNVFFWSRIALPEHSSERGTNNKPANLFRFAGLFLVGVAGFEPATSCSQSRRDDRATLHPEKCAERLGLEPRQHLRADRLAICSVTTPAPLQSDLTFGIKVGAKILLKGDSNKKK